MNRLFCSASALIVMMPLTYGGSGPESRLSAQFLHERKNMRWAWIQEGS